MYNTNLLENLSIIRTYTTKSMLNISLSPCRQLYISFLSSLFEETFMLNLNSLVRSDTNSMVIKIPDFVIKNFGTRRLITRLSLCDVTNIIHVYGFIDMFVQPILYNFNKEIESNKFEDEEYLISIFKKYIWLSFIQVEGIRFTCKSLTINDSIKCKYNCKKRSVEYVIIYLINEKYLLSNYLNILNKINSFFSEDIKIIFDCSNICINDIEDLKSSLDELLSLTSNIKNEIYFVECSEIKDVLQSYDITNLSASEVRKLLNIK